MIKERTREEWQEIINDYVPSKGSQRNYCKDKKINYSTFRYWHYKLKQLGGFRQKEQVIQETKELAGVTKEIVNKEFIELKIAPDLTKIELPNGIKIDVVTGNIYELIRKLYHVA